MTKESNYSMTFAGLEGSIRAAHSLPNNKVVLNTLLEISKEIPDNVNSIDAHMAEYLAGRFLKGLDMCGELYALAVSYEMKMELLKRKEFSDAMIIRSATLNLKTAKEKEFYAHSDAGYLAIADKHVEAKMFRLLVEEKRDAFFKSHYLMRKIVDKDVHGNNSVAVYSDTSDPSTEWRRHSTWVANE